jgi:hypothetical protein
VISSIKEFEAAETAGSASKMLSEEAWLVIVMGFKTRAGLRVGYAGYGYGLDFADPHRTRTLGTGSGLPAL